ncbi:iron-containing alcohol dehydrogenase [Oceanicola sp. 22II-s10i]|uniref:iron-containing alcohol dehydrogenase n=1 Tax=Oceanicola sp. 22II-s10i TaxID=1317116 RepID=UPI00159585F5|nr:iron-containing alcohol dehydrogenase [Oceanicola sp. 22II-s10i]
MTQPTLRPPLPAVRTFIAPKSHRVVSGPGAIATLGDHLGRLGSGRAFILTGRSVAEKTPLIDQLRAAAPDRISGVYSGMSAHTPLADLVAALEAAREAGADAIVGIGGGAVMDACKHMITYLTLDLRTADEIRAYLSAQLPDPAPIPDMLPQILIPTTASAAEFTQFAGVLDSETQSKRRLDHTQTVPDVIIQDPDAVLYTPPELWLSSAIRTVDHAVEGLYGHRATPYTDALGKEALRLLARGLPAFHADPKDTDAIADIQAATWLGITCGSLASTGISHGIGYLLGAKFGVPHGHCSCITLQHVAAWMVPGAEHALAEAARALGAASGGDADAVAAAQAGPAIGRLVAGLGLPVRARDAGVPSLEALVALAPNVLRLPHIPGSPRRPADEAEAAALLDQMW